MGAVGQGGGVGRGPMAHGLQGHTPTLSPYSLGFLEDVSPRPPINTAQQAAIGNLYYYY